MFFYSDYKFIKVDVYVNYILFKTCFNDKKSSNTHGKKLFDRNLFLKQTKQKP